MRRHQGLSVTELLIGLVVMALVLLGVGQLLSAGFLQTARSTSEALEKSDLASFRSFLSKRIVVGDIRFSFFSGAPESGSPNPFSMLVPLMQPRTFECRDLSASTGVCNNSFSLMAASFESAERMLPAICSYPDPSNPHFRQMVFDLGAGPSPITYVSTSQRFSATAWGSATLHVPDSTPLALFDPPRATLWASSGIPATLNWTQNPVTGAFPVGLVPASCISAFRPTGPSSNGLGTLYDVSRLVRVRITPLMMASTMGNISNITATHIDSALGVVPARVFPVTLLLIGTKNENVQRGPGSFGVNSCQYSVASRSIVSCGTELVSVPNVQSSQIFMRYSEDFVPGTYRYQVKRPNQPNAPSCVAPSCLPMPILSTGLVPFVPGESLIQMSGSQYSSMKQEFLQSLEIRLRLKNRTSDEVIHVKLSP